ncbi:MAG TPA: pentapeptide repeat-containing protein, partial [Coxiellaceae bacterium]|nr:pentapeptide repeat-containing protein [Coxiellaceae bacterium]
MAADNSKLRVLMVLVSICVIIGGGLAYLVHHHRSAGIKASAGVVSAPNIESIPGEGNPTDIYVKTQQQQNAMLVKEARETGTSAVPTITRPSFIGNLETLQAPTGETVTTCPVNVNGVSIKPTPGSCSVENLKLARSAGVHAQELRCQACSCTVLKEAGFNAADLKAAGFSALDLKNCGFTLAELVQAGFTAAELKAAGFSAAELKAAGFTAAQLKAAGFTAAQLKDAGFT